jgi:hypothetical protein
MSVINPRAIGLVNTTGQQGQRRQAHAPHPKKEGHQLSPLGRAGKIAFAPLAGVAKGLTSGTKATAAATTTVGALAYTSHPLLAATVGVGSFIGVPLYAAAKAIGRLLSNLKAGITGHTAPGQ